MDMTQYRRAKKYLRFIVPLLIIFGAILVPKVDHSPKTLGVSARSSTGNLKVSQSGGQMYTNVTADSLQPAKAPDHSATTAGLNPQQATPNYCASSEQPIIDGCITK